MWSPDRKPSWPSNVDHGDIDSRYQGHAAIADAHEYRAKALRELPITAQSLMKGEPVIPTEITVL